MADLSKRVVILMSPELTQEIDEFRWLHRLTSRGDAIRMLCEAALKCRREKEPDRNERPTPGVPERAE